MNYTSKLRECGHYEEIQGNGDYAWLELWPEGQESRKMQGVMLSCPRCGHEAALPYTITIKSKDPLSIKDKLHCPACKFSFWVREGLVSLETLETQDQVREGFLQEVPKTWGREYWVRNYKEYCLKFLCIDPGGCSSLHYHRNKKETFWVEEGACFLELEGVVHQLTRHDSVDIDPGQKHRFWAEARGTGCMIIEVSTQHEDSDVVRLEESKRL